MIDLVKTYLTRPWGPPWTLATLGDMLENGYFGGNWPFSSMSLTLQIELWALQAYLYDIRQILPSPMRDGMTSGQEQSRSLSQDRLRVS